jgi:hypothetical protein
VLEPKETCEENWQKHKGDLQVLIAMSIGLKTEDGSRNLADLDEDDLYVLHLSKQYYPRAPVLANEMARRAKAAGMKKFRKSSLSKPEKMNWLKQNPVTDEADIGREEQKVYNILIGIEAESKATAKEKLQNAN